MAKRLTPAETEYIIANWGNKTTKEISEALGRSPSAINVKANRLGLTGSNKDNPCIGCKYWKGWCCDYIGEHKGRRRPCKGGAECTARELGETLPSDTDFTLYEGAPFDSKYLSER